MFDFVGPETDSELPEAEGKNTQMEGQSLVVSALGRRLAKDFNAELRQLAPTLEVDSWDDVSQRFDGRSYLPDVISDLGTEWWIAQTLKFKFFVWGDLKVQPGGTPLLHVACLDAEKARSTKGSSVRLPLTPEMEKLNEVAFKDTSLASYPPSGKNGYTYPRCVFCPPAQYSPAALRKKYEDTVKMEAIITTGGRAADIKILRASGLGLTEQAIEAVEKWRFAPALGPDGKPAAVRQVIEVTFHLY